MIDPKLLLSSNDIRDLPDNNSEYVGELAEIPSDDEGRDIVVENGEVPDDSLLFDEKVYRPSSESDSDKSRPTSPGVHPYVITS